MHDGNSVTKYLNTHNYHPPSKPQVLKEVKDQCVLQLSVEASPSNIHSRSQCVLKVSCLCANNAQLHNWKHALSVKDMLTGMAFSLFVIFLLLLFFTNLILICLQVMHSSTLPSSILEHFCSYVNLQRCVSSLRASLD
jgi:hypothetical protein